MPTRCTCGSDTFVIEYRTVAQVTVTHGRPSEINYTAPRPGDLFATVTCTGCDRHLDVDGTITRRDTGSPECPADGVALRTARKIGDLWAPGFPALSVKTVQPGCTPGSTTTSTTNPTSHRRRPPGLPT